MSESARPNLVTFDPAARRSKVVEALAESKGSGAPVSTTTQPIHVTLPEPPIIRVDSLIDQANEALERMGRSNPNRGLIVAMGNAINELVTRLEAAERELRLLRARVPPKVE